jgi:phosphate transport system permease protein
VEAGRLAASPRLRRRRLVERALGLVAILSAVGAVAVLVVVVASVAIKGGRAISWSFLTKSPALFGQSGGGIAPAIVGTAVIVAWAIVIAVPVGVLTAVYITEFAPRRVGRWIRITLDILNGVPAIVVGIFVFGLLVTGHGQSGFAGSFALSILMVPMVARATQEVLALVPRSLREASLGLGVSRWRTVVQIVLPQTLGGILTGAILATARVAGETAPLLFTSSIAANAVSTNAQHALQSIPVTIFVDSEAPDPALHAQAWAAALVLITFVLVSSLGARSILGWRKRRFDLQSPG